MNSGWGKLWRSVYSDRRELPRQLVRMVLSRKYPQIGKLVGTFGSKPTFLLIGTQKGGTTSLYSYLASHPQVSASIIHEIHYFSFNYNCGERWYRAHFLPPWWLRSRGLQVGEASTSYLFIPWVPARVAAFAPDLKLIVMLRNPVDRAYSHYKMSVRQGRETLSFEKAIALESERLQRERGLFGPDKAFAQGTSHRVHSYLLRGHYAEQLERWFAHFPHQQILILESEKFFFEPERLYTKVQAFLGLPEYHLSTYHRFNAGGSSSIDPEVGTRLTDYFAPHNTRLSDLLGRSFWI